MGHITLKRVLLSLLIVPILLSTIPPSLVSADPHLNDRLHSIPSIDITADPAYWTTTARINSALYERALVRCMESALTTDTPISAENASSLDGWSQGRILSGVEAKGALLDPSDDGVLNCSNENGWVAKALKLWKINTNTEALCIFGWYRQDSSANGYSANAGSYNDCVNGSGIGFYNSTRTSTSVLPRVITSTNDLLDRLQQARGISIKLPTTDVYVLYKNTLELGGAGCGAKQIVKLSDANADQKAILNTNKGLTVTVIEGEGANATSTKYIYQLGDKNKTDTVEIGSYLENYPIYTRSSGSQTPAQDGKNQCDYIAGVVNETAADYLVAVKASKANPNADSAGDLCSVNKNSPTCTAANTSTCPVDGIGWIVCPVVNALAGLDDAMYAWIKSVLTLNPLQTTNSDGSVSPQYLNWQTIRNIANILLVIIFLIVIFSQTTSLGISNYGVKKMLPRIILVAIAINLSYFLMSLAVDLVNIVGVGLGDLLGNLPVSATAATINQDNAVSSFVTGLLASTVATGIGVAVLGATGIGAGALVLLALPFILVAVLSLLAAVATLFVRNALVIVLVVIAPVAIAAYLLPNTEEWFNKWRKLFTSMLFLFPMAALLFAGAKFAAYVILTSNQPLSILAAIFIMAAPLGALPWLARSSNSIMSAVGNRLQGLAKMAKAPAQRGLKPYVERSKSRYRDGQTNAFGRRYSDAKLAKRAAAGKRNAAQAWQRRGLDRDNETETNKTNAMEAYREEGRKEYDTTTGSRRQQRLARRNQKRSDRTGGILDAGQTAGARKATNDSAFQERLEDRINTPGSVESRYQAQQFDTQQGIERAKSEVTERNQERVRQNVVSTTTGEGLANISQDKFAADARTKALEGTILNINRGSGVADVAVQQQKANELEGKVLDTEEQTTFEGSIPHDNTLVDLVQREDNAKREGEALGAERKEMLDLQADATPELRQADERKEAATFTSSTIASGQSADLEQRKQLGGDLFGLNAQDAANKASEATYKKQTDQVFREAATNSDAAHLETIDPNVRATLQQAQLNARVADSATARADSTLQQEFADEILSNPTTAADAAGIDLPGGIPLVEAQAYETQRKAYDANVAAYSVRLSEQGTPDSISDETAARIAADTSLTPEERTAMTTTLIDIARDESRTPEERDAAGRAIVAKNNIEAIKPYQDYLATSLRSAQAAQATAKASGNLVEVEKASKELRTIQDLQKSFGNSIGSSPGKPMGLGAADIAALQTGTYVPPTPSFTPQNLPVDFSSLSTSQIQTLNTVNEKGVSMDNWAAMDKDDIKDITKLVESGLVSPERVAGMWATVDTALADPRWYGRIKEREEKLLENLIGVLDQGPIKKPRTKRKK